MSTQSSLAQKLTSRLKVRQPIIWIETDEPSRCAGFLRAFVKQFFTANPPANPEHTASLYEWSIQHGMFALWNGKMGDLFTEVPNGSGHNVKIPGIAVDFFNRTATAKPGLPSPALPRHNFDPQRPWAFFSDILTEAPLLSTMICHNLAELIDAAARSPIPHGRALMRNALLELTGNLSLATPTSPLTGTSRVILATGRLPDSDIARAEIADTFDVLTLDRPSEEELCEGLRAISEGLPAAYQNANLRDTPAAFGTDNLPEALRRASKNLRGLTKFGAETAALRTLIDQGKLTPASLAEHRKTLIERTPALTLMEPNPLFSWDRVKGLEHIEELAKVALRPGLDSRLRANAFTFVGPPGTGKSMGAVAIAQYLGWPMVRFDLSLVFQSLVGKSQSTMQQVINTLDALGDVVVLIDEADKQMSGLISDGGQRGDSGVGSQVMGLFLTWEEKRTANASRALVIRTANRIGNLKTESLRAGRNDITFFVDFPHRSVRKAILEQYLGDYGVSLPADEINAIATRTRMWSGAELKELSRNIARFGDHDQAFRFVRPVSDMDPEDIAQLRIDGAKAGTPAAKLSVDDEAEVSRDPACAASMDRALATMEMAARGESPAGRLIG